MWTYPQMVSRVENSPVKPGRLTVCTRASGPLSVLERLVASRTVRAVATSHVLKVLPIEQFNARRGSKA